ncbi:ATP-grasp domain-containing protein [Streptomyces candidus]|uniref:Biotin carboxylase n=1 Tax=Streptomyces candidus TaxID=67283 RepID=A0A7X0LNC1_9ACTN|nr:ATP-grasp domain-containing protein [Streptomyces candidus]MBB6434712.1 biotin carboxylase [Streptomyces candidus]GHH35681.1 carboxylase [Streptomyces candidus]
MPELGPGARPGARSVVVFVGLRKNPLEHRPAFEAAHREGYAVVLLAARPPAGLPGALLAEARAVDPHDTAVFDAVVDEIAVRHSVAGVVTWSDAGVEPAARAARRLGLPGITPAAARLARNKYLMRQALSGQPHLIPRYARVRTLRDAEQALEHVGFPAVLKPAAGSGSKGIFLLRSAGDLPPAFAELDRLTGADGDSIFRNDRGELVLEELLGGSEHSVEGFVHRGEVTVCGITDKTTTEPFRLELAHQHPSALPPAAASAVRALTREVVVALGFDDCAFHLECMYDEETGTARLVEVAARAGGDFIGSHLVGLASGVPFHENVIRVATGRAPRVPDRPPLHAGLRKMMAPAAGKLVRVDGLDTALGVTGVQHVVLDRAPGTTVKLPPEHFSSSAVGAVIATGDSAESVANALRAATDALHVEMAPGPEGHAPGEASTHG